METTMAITLVGEVVNHCDDLDGWEFPKFKKPKKDKEKDEGGGNAANMFWNG
jgi:hypothetical protein